MTGAEGCEIRHPPDLLSSWHTCAYNRGHQRDKQAAVRRRQQVDAPESAATLPLASLVALPS
jgi:hypothetical protein